MNVLFTRLHFLYNTYAMLHDNDFVTMRALDAIFVTLKFIVDEEIADDTVVLWHNSLYTCFYLFIFFCRAH